MADVRNELLVVMKARDEMSREMAKASGNVKKAGIGMADVAKKTTLAFTVMGAAVLALGVAAFKLGKDFDEAYDTIRVGTGAVGKDLDGLKDSFKNVLKNVPTDFKLASQAIADLNTRTGQTGKGLEELAKATLELSRLTKTDLSSNIAGVTRVFGDWSVAVSDQVSAIDRLFRASQMTGISVTDLQQKLVAYGAPLRAMNFTLDESAALLGKWEKEGVNTELVLGSMRIAMGNFAEAGVPMRQGLEFIINQIQALGPGAEATSLAMKIFGARAGPDMAAAILEGRFELGNLVRDIANGKDSVIGLGKETADASEKMKMAWNKVQVAIEPIASELFNLVGVLIDELGPALDDSDVKLAALAKSWGTLGAESKRNILIIAGLLVGGGPLLLGLSFAYKAIVALGNAFVVLKVKALAEISIIAGAAGILGDTFKSLANFLTTGRFELPAGTKSWWKNYADWFSNFFTKMLPEQAGAAFGTLEQAIGSPLVGLRELQAAMGRPSSGLQEILNAATLAGAELDEFGNVVEKVGGAGEQTGEILGALGNKIGQAAAAIDRGMYLPQLIAMHPAMIAASDAVKMWETRISELNLAIQANQDQLGAAQSVYAGMQENLTSLNKELSTLKERLTELANPRLTGMGDIENKIAAVEKHIKRLQYAATSGMPLEDVMKLFPVMGKGMEAYISTLPPAIRENAKWAEQFAANLRLTKDLKFEEQLRLIREAAGETKKEMSFEDVIKSIAETKLKIDDVTGAVQVQEKAMAAQQAVIKGLEDRQKELNQALRNYQTELSKAQDYQRELNDLLRDAYDWFFKDKDAVEQMGGAAVLIAGDITMAYENILTQVETAVSTATTNIGAVIADTQTKIGALKASLADIAGKAGGGATPDSFSTKGGLEAAGGTIGGWYVPPFGPPKDVWDKWLEIPTWFVGTMGEGGWKDEIERASDKYRQALVLAANDMEKQHRARLALADEMNRIKAEYNWWAEKLAQERLNAKAPVAQPSSQYLTEMARAQTIEWTNWRARNPNAPAEWFYGPWKASGGANIEPRPSGASVVVNVRNEADMHKVLKYVDRELGLTAGPSPV